MATSKSETSRLAFLAVLLAQFVLQVPSVSGGRLVPAVVSHGSSPDKSIWRDGFAPGVKLNARSLRAERELSVDQEETKNTFHKAPVGQVSRSYEL